MAEAQVQSKGIASSVIAGYAVELNEVQERTIKNIVAVLKKHSVTDELIRARALAYRKQFVTDCFNVGAEAGVY